MRKRQETPVTQGNLPYKHSVPMRKFLIEKLKALFEAITKPNYISFDLQLPEEYFLLCPGGCISGRILPLRQIQDLGVEKEWYPEGIDLLKNLANPHADIVLQLRTASQQTEKLLVCKTQVSCQQILSSDRRCFFEEFSSIHFQSIHDPLFLSPNSILYRNTQNLENKRGQVCR